MTANLGVKPAACRHSTTGGSEVVVCLIRQRAGLRVARNTPFAGAFIAQSYGRPSARRHVIQVEIDRGLYMDEATITPHAGFEDFRALMAGVIAEIADIGRASLPLAAE